MSHPNTNTTSSRSFQLPTRRLGAAGLAACLIGSGGCTVDSFFDPSVVGRWEHTPTVVPILERISAIEVGDDEHVETSQILSEDLIPEIAEYRLGPGDQAEIRIRDFYRLGVEEPFIRTVSPRGMIEIPRLEPILALDLSREELKQAVVDAVAAAEIKSNAVVSVEITGQRQRTFHALGNVRSAGTYFIPKPDYRLLEALAAAGGFSESVPYIYIIRQIPLSERVTGVSNDSPLEPPERVTPDDNTPANPDDLIELIDEISSPAVYGMSVMQPDDAPPIDLIDDVPDRSDTGSGESGSTSWMFVNGRWVRVTRGAGDPDELNEAESVIPDREDLSSLVTQRVIEVPTAPLIAGAAEFNVVIRAGDIVRVPTPSAGLVYVSGQVARPGSFRLPDDGRMTLLRALDSAGGLGGLAVPERVDLMRMVGPDKQATIRVNLRAIASQTQPDIFLKSNDRVVVGTNFWAFPLAVIRGGFRASYGFGFLLDRNFGPDVFGAPPRDNN